MPKLTRSGLAMLGAEDAAAGEPVYFQVVLEHDDDGVHDFSCVVRAPAGGGFGHLYGRPLVLDIAEGPTFGVVIVHMDGDEAVLQLRS
ncbi:MAG: hypothetical protein ACK41C_14330 [Phenylobacterium sp.]|uniref:hypothetical protein n=1 Tax=Phenylobacterium sp. TaxID=1871053 RepID=UPI00391AB035